MGRMIENYSVLKYICQQIPECRQAWDDEYPYVNVESHTTLKGAEFLHVSTGYCKNVHVILVKSSKGVKGFTAISDNYSCEMDDNGIIHEFIRDSTNRIHNTYSRDLVCLSRNTGVQRAA